jgi:hypothetical protein
VGAGAPLDRPDAKKNARQGGRIPKGSSLGGPGDAAGEGDGADVAERSSVGPTGVEGLAEGGPGSQLDGVQAVGISTEHPRRAGARTQRTEQQRRLAVAAEAGQRLDQRPHHHPQLSPRTEAVPVVDQGREGRQHRGGILGGSRGRGDERVSGDAGHERQLGLVGRDDGLL